MRLRQGKIGIAEGCAVCVISLFVNGVFALDPGTAYEGGNSAYLSVPLSVLLSLMLAAFALLAMERAGEGSLDSLIGRSFGRIPGALLSVILALSFVLSAAKPLEGFVEVLHRLVYDGVSYTSILLFLFPAIVVIAWKGFESIGRIALIFFGLIFVSAAVAVISASPEFSSDRLFPLPSTESFLGLTRYEGLYLLTPSAALLVNSRGLGGVGTTRRILAISSVTAALVIGLTQLALALIYPYRVLSGILMPLYRINFLSLSQSYLLRLDKLFIMIWLAGCAISSAYLIYSAALLTSRSFGAKDVTPAVLTLSFVLCALVFIGFEKEYAAVVKLGELTGRWGFLLPALPLALVSLTGIIKKRKIEL